MVGVQFAVYEVKKHTTQIHWLIKRIVLSQAYLILNGLTWGSTCCQVDTDLVRSRSADVSHGVRQKDKQSGPPVQSPFPSL